MRAIEDANSKTFVPEIAIYVIPLIKMWSLILKCVLLLLLKKPFVDAFTYEWSSKWKLWKSGESILGTCLFAGILELDPGYLGIIGLIYVLLAEFQKILECQKFSNAQNEAFSNITSPSSIYEYEIPRSRWLFDESLMYLISKLVGPYLMISKGVHCIITPKKDCLVPCCILIACSFSKIRIWYIGNL